MQIRFASLVAMVFCLATTLAHAATPTTKPGEHILVYTVLDAGNHQPVPDLALRVDQAGRGRGGNNQYMTDEKGNASIVVPDGEVQYFSISINEDGYVPVRSVWPARNNGRAGQDKVPDTYTVNLEPAVDIGGTVVDDAGAPVPGATIVIEIQKKLSNPNDSVGVNWEHVKSDASGKWVYDKAPEKFDQVEIGVYHAKYAGRDGNYDMSPFADMAGLHAQTAKLVLQRGVPVTGVIYGKDNKPVPGAKIGQGADRMASNVLPEVTSDKDGKFTLASMPGSTVTLTVKAPGYSPDLKQFPLDGTKQPIEFHLAPPGVIKGKIVDSAGKPIKGAYIYTDTWRNCRTIELQGRSNAEGHFEIRNAPVDAIQCNVQAEGFGYQQGIMLTASDTETTITLKTPLTVSGTVTDAETGKPIEQFRVVPGIKFNDEQPVQWERYNSALKARPEGKFHFTEEQAFPAYQVRIEAPGYLPTESKVFKQEDGDPKLELKLAKGHDLTGTVTDAAGKPVAGAAVLVATVGQPVYLQNGRSINFEERSAVQTDDKGHYDVPPQTGKYTLVFVSDSGHAEATADQLAKSADVTLAAWGRVEGVVIAGGKPVGGAIISSDSFETMADNDQPRITFQNQVTSDAAGHFVFERVRPGKLTITRMEERQEGQYRTQMPVQTAKADVKPGETTQVQIGGHGRPVIGKISLPPEITNTNSWQFAYSQLSTMRDFPEPDMPDDVRVMQPKDMMAWRKTWMKSDAGKAFIKSFREIQENAASYSLKIEKDGTFRAEDVEAGSYTLAVSVTDSAMTPGKPMIPLGQLQQPVTVPDMPGGHSDEPLDLGTIPMTAIAHGSAAGAAPAINCKTLDGKDLKLDNYKGKYVVLDFWMTNYDQLTYALPPLKTVYDSYAGNDKFAMIGLSLDPKPDISQRFVNKNGVKWPQAFLGGWRSPTVRSLMLEGMPTIWILGPDGKILAKGIKAEGLATELQKYLGSPTTKPADATTQP